MPADRSTRVLLVLVLVSLLLNGFLLWQWLVFRSEVRNIQTSLVGALDQASIELEAFRSSTIEFQVSIQDEIPIRTTFPVEESFMLAIETTLPIQQEFDTTILVDAPFGLTVPVDVTVPVDIEVPVDLDLPIRLQESFEVDTTVPVDLDVPVQVDVAGTELAAVVDRVAVSLQAIRRSIAGE